MADGVMDLIQQLNFDVHNDVVELIEFQEEDDRAVNKQVVDDEWARTFRKLLKGTK